MFKYFQTNKRKVNYNNTLLEDAEVVSCLSTAVDILIPDGYTGEEIMGKMYDPSTQQFYDCEIIPEEPTVDPELEARIIDAYTLELIEMGLL